MTDTTINTKRLVLNDDTVICRDCYEPQVLELDADRVPMGESDQLPCSICGANDDAAANQPGPERDDDRDADPPRHRCDAPHGLIAQLSAAGAEIVLYDEHDYVSWPAERRALLEQLDAVDDE